MKTLSKVRTNNINNNKTKLILQDAGLNKTPNNLDSNSSNNGGWTTQTNKR